MKFYRKLVETLWGKLQNTRRDSAEVEGTLCDRMLLILLNDYFRRD
jgi:hypothetical protein